MELKQIKELMTAMERSAIKRLTVKKEGFEIQLEREDSSTHKDFVHILEHTDDNPMRADLEKRRSNTPLIRNHQQQLQSPSSQSQAPQEKEEELPGTFITSPMVGTFYITLSPESPPCVKVGDHVEKNTVVGVIEAMKVMNEIKAGVAGVVGEILIENGQPVEFGTKIFRINT